MFCHLFLYTEVVTCRVSFLLPNFRMYSKKKKKLETCISCIIAKARLERNKFSLKFNLYCGKFGWFRLVLLQLVKLLSLSLLNYLQNTRTPSQGHVHHSKIFQFLSLSPKHFHLAYSEVKAYFLAVYMYTLGIHNDLCLRKGFEVKSMDDLLADWIYFWKILVTLTYP